MILSPKIKSVAEASEFLARLNSPDPFIQVDNSTWSSWEGCTIKGFLTDVIRRISAQNQAALVYGTCFHEGQAEWYTSGELNLTLQKTQEAANELRLDALNDPKRTSERVVQAVHENISYLQLTDQMFAPLEIGTELMVEKSFSTLIGSIEINGKPVKIYWTGKLDLIEQDRSGSLWMVDHKTTSMLGDRFLDDKIRSSQFLGYSLPCRELGLDITGVKINACCTYVNRFETRVYEVPIAKWKVEEWRRGVLVSIKHEVEGLLQSLKTEVMPGRREHCVTKYGRCPYFDLCDSHPKMRDEMLFSPLFTENTWKGGLS